MYARLHNELCVISTRRMVVDSVHLWSTSYCKYRAINTRVLLDPNRFYSATRISIVSRRTRRYSRRFLKKRFCSLLLTRPRRASAWRQTTQFNSCFTRSSGTHWQGRQEGGRGYIGLTRRNDVYSQLRRFSIDNKKRSSRRTNKSQIKIVRNTFV